MKRRILTAALAAGMCVALPFGGIRNAHAQGVDYNPPAVVASGGTSAPAGNGAYLAYPCGVYTCIRFRSSAFESGPYFGTVMESGIIRFVNFFGRNGCARASIQANLIVPPALLPGGRASEIQSFRSDAGSVCWVNDLDEEIVPLLVEPDVFDGEWSYTSFPYGGGGGHIHFLVDTSLMGAFPPAFLPPAGVYCTSYNGGIAPCVG